MYEPEKLVVAELSIDLGQSLLLNSSSILVEKFRLRDQLTREATEIELHHKNINWEGGSSLSRLWKPLIHSLEERANQLLPPK
jgi:hypothetical protein